MLTEGPFASSLSDEEMQAKQQARRAAQFNFTVARFGPLKFKELIESLFGEKEFKIDFDALSGPQLHALEGPDLYVTA